MKIKTIFLSFAAFALLANGPVQAGPYLDSAHGNTDYGVEWTVDPFYTQGHCGHCHIQHDSIDGDQVTDGGPFNFALFYDDYVALGDNFCFQCHRIADLGYGQVENFPYCVTFGGYTEYYGAIKKQFTNANSKPAACGSRHYLNRIRNRLNSAQYSAWGFNGDADPCVGCHPPHAVQRPYPPDITGGKLNTCIRLPSKYKSTAAADLLWGDDDGERMDDYAAANGGVYQPPYYGNTSGSKFEPTGTAMNYAGERTPDYVTFCMECHVDEQLDPEQDDSEIEGAKVVRAIVWDGPDADVHGSAHANTCTSGAAYEGTLRPPYTDSPNSNYILSCLDCHEPHGTKKRMHLIRRMINGEEIPIDVPDGWGYCDSEGYESTEICERCHDWAHKGPSSCVTCHGYPESEGFHGGKLLGPDCFGYPGF